MKHNEMRKKSISKVLSLGLLMLITLFATQSRAADQELQLTAQGCNVTVKSIGGNSCDNNECGSDSSCICLAKGQHAKWLLAGTDKFKLKFSENSPLKDNCGKNFKKGKHKCVVKDSTSKGEEYSYEVVLERCPHGTDPKIIIK